MERLPAGRVRFAVCHVACVWSVSLVDRAAMTLTEKKRTNTRLRYPPEMTAPRGAGTKSASGPINPPTTIRVSDSFVMTTLEIASSPLPKCPYRHMSPTNMRRAAPRPMRPRIRTEGVFMLSPLCQPYQTHGTVKNRCTRCGAGKTRHPGHSGAHGIGAAMRGKKAVTSIEEYRFHLREYQGGGGHTSRLTITLSRFQHQCLFTCTDTPGEAAPTTRRDVSKDLIAPRELRHVR